MEGAGAARVWAWDGGGETNSPADYQGTAPHRLTDRPTAHAVSTWHPTHTPSHPALHPQWSDTDLLTASHPTLHPQRSDTDPLTASHPTLHPQRSDTDPLTASHPTLHPQRSDTDPPTAPHPTLYGLTRTRPQHTPNTPPSTV